MRFTRCWSTAVACAFAFALVGCPPGQPRTPPPTVGEPLGELSEDYLTGIGPRSLAEARGMVVVVEFWATYCEPCKRSFPAYEKLHKNAGVAVISVALDEHGDVAEDAIKKFADDTGATFAVLWDRDQSTVDRFGLRKMPTAFVVDQKGVLRHIHGGYDAAVKDDIQREVEALLAEGNGAAPTP